MRYLVGGAHSRPKGNSMADGKKDLSRRHLLRLDAAAAVTAILGEPVSFLGTQQSGPRTPAPTHAEELVLMNGKIHTMDRNNTIVQTVSIKNGRFSTVDRKSVV